MTIHHDKMAYGKLADLSEKLSEEKLKAMAALLSEQPDEAEEQEDAAQKKRCRPSGRRGKKRGGRRQRLNFYQDKSNKNVKN